MDCEDVRFSINKQEIVINPDEHCQDWTQSGILLAKHFLSTADYRSDIYPLIYNYYKMDQNLALNGSDEHFQDTKTEIEKRVCREIMAHDIAIVKVRLESNTYMKTIKSKRFSFADKLAFFGM